VTELPAHALALLSAGAVPVAGDGVPGPREAGLSDEVCVVVVTDSALVAGKDTDDAQDHLSF
jgi:hypothetical protein